MRRNLVYTASGTLAVVILALYGLLAVPDPFTAGPFASDHLAAGQFALGVLATGEFAAGVASLGIFSAGVVSVGAFSVGVFSVGVFRSDSSRSACLRSGCSPADAQDLITRAITATVGHRLSTLLSVPFRVLPAH